MTSTHTAPPAGRPDATRASSSGPPDPAKVVEQTRVDLLKPAQPVHGQPEQTGGGPRHARPDDARTFVRRPLPEAAPGEERRRELRAGRRLDRLNVTGSLLAALAFTALLFGQIAPFDGVLGFVVVVFFAFLAFLGLLTSLTEDGPAIRDRIAAAVMTGIGMLLLALLVIVVGFTFWRAWPALVHGNFWVEDMSVVQPASPLDVGGALHAIVGTLEQMGIALILSVPLGITCAVFLGEIPGRFSRFVRTLVEAMTALPSIVAGLFIYAGLILALDQSKSGLAAGIALSVMTLPIIIRAADVVLRLVPGTLKEASFALGASQWRTVWHVVLPTARSGLTTAVILGTARGIGETSPVLITAGFTQFMALNPAAGPQVSLPLLVFNSVRFPQQEMVTRGFGAGAVLMLLVLVLFAAARVIGGRGPGELSPGQLRRRAVASALDVKRFQRRRQADLDGTSQHRRQANPDGEPDKEFLDVP
ncbi:phosphate ABC transporter permease PstA [Dactylosporangium sp. NPDC000521]|uniref:phosphate ABC transporter permease PstA n=1 Tax=Dactylosporangium sp. NPDC000521 TaxID=3363975 RepID=UPI0036BF7724